MITSDFILEKARQSKIDRFSVLREYLQLLFLRYFYEEKNLDFKAFFKGGTSIRFLYNSFRFSEDLDFTIIGKAEKIGSWLWTFLPRLEKEAGLTVTIKDEKNFEEAGWGYRLVFQGELAKQPLGIRLDFSMREKPLEPEVSFVSVFDYPVSPLPLVNHLSREEILAEKVRAIVVRGKPRDLFDLWFLLKQGTLINLRMVKEKMKYYPEVIFDQKVLADRIKQFKPDDLKKDLNQFIPENARQYEKFIPETIDLLRKTFPDSF